MVSTSKLRAGLGLAVFTLVLIVGFQWPCWGIISATGQSPTRKPLPLNQYTGVVYLDPVACSGSLLKGGMYVLTAAHCLNEGRTSPDENVTVVFKLPGSVEKIPVGLHIVHPGWTGYTSEVGHDIALLKLKRLAPPDAEQYELYRRKDEVGQVFTKVGYGYLGTGSQGQDDSSNTAIRRYAGQNRYEAVIDILRNSTESDFSELVLGSQLLFDFDSGRSTHDALGRHFPKLADAGLGEMEIGTGNGDSAGPSFIGGKIAGISSWGYSDRGFFKGNIADIDSIDNNGSFGEIFGDTRVSFYIPWLDKIMATY
ncbi:trypsin-like serine protease [Synechococcus sp. PCC 6312]|uniref:trypsin-like serine protease n=1 Tax=Synechococcus sp. (strain ATCC 27167 / PCC 6312) TaxID=195253 RepID=UPI00029F1AD1|nr:trypsin-like serine protease [Synechococcus sp. PCC 6312]AFY60606.1 secreted trypsin-like serine protease [Synechococcus sp. PCC 6312]